LGSCALIWFFKNYLFDILCGMGLGLCNNHMCRTSQIRTFFLGFGPWGEGFSGWQCYHKVVFRSRRFAHVSPNGCLLLKTPRSESVLRVLPSIKIIIIFWEKKSHDTQWVSNGYSSDLARKNDTRHFIKWNAHACEHFVFQNASWDFTLCKINEALYH
jgi:hypothetical protein